jgi:hypothetical protein
LDVELVGAWEALTLDVNNIDKALGSGLWALAKAFTNA